MVAVLNGYKNTKYIWKFNKVTNHPIVISAEAVVSKKLSKIVKELAIPFSIVRVG